MNCMKCGREAEPGEVFCAACLKSMAESPVKPGTPVTIPKRPARSAPPAAKKARPEEFEALLCKKIHRLQLLCAVLAAALVLSLGLLAWQWGFSQEGGFDIGQNYSAETTAPPPAGR